MKRRLWVAVVSLLFLIACAGIADKNALLGDLFSDDLEPVAFKQQTGEHGSKKTKVEWIACLPEKNENKGVVFVFNEQHPSCKAEEFQAFIRHGYVAMTVQRFKHTFFGPSDIDRIEKAVNGIEQIKTWGGVKGIYGWDWGTVAASFLSKKVSPEWIILGGGLYDLDLTKARTKDKRLKEELDQLREKGDIEIEDRSIAYDPDGLPGKVFLFHGDSDMAAPVQLAKDFSQSLKASQVEAMLEIVEDGKHKLDPGDTELVIDAILRIHILKTESL